MKTFNVFSTLLKKTVGFFSDANTKENNVNMCNRANLRPTYSKYKVNT